MKKIFFIICFLIYGTNLGSTWDIEANTVAHYKFNDNADSNIVINSKGEPCGVSARNTSAMHVDGKIGGALNFSELTDDVNCNQTLQPTFKATDSNGFTISFWANFTELGEGKYLFHPADFSYNMLYQTEGDYGYRLYFGYLTGNIISPDTSEHILKTGVWDMWTCMVEKVSSSLVDMSMYKNAVLIKQSNNLTVNMSTYPAKNFILGSDIYNPMSSSLDDFRIINRALTADEILGLYNNGHGTEDSNGILISKIINNGNRRR